LPALLLGVVLCPTLPADWQIKEIAQLDQGVGGTFGWILGYRSSPDSQPLLIFNGSPNGTHILGNFYYRYVPVNRYRFVKFDTMWDSLAPGDAYPWAVGDVNGDSVPVLVGIASTIDSERNDGRLVMYKPAVRGGCPDSLVAQYRYSSVIATAPPCYIADLAHDGHKEIFFLNAGAGGQIYFFGVEGDSLQLDTVLSPYREGEWSMAIGDFDQDGQMEFATAGGSTDNWVMVYKCTGPNQYVTWDSCLMSLPNGSDVFSSDNIDGAHHAALFASFFDVYAGMLWLYEFAPTQGTHDYQAFLVDSATMPSGTGPQTRSFCGSIDGGDTDEIVWSTGVSLRAYKCTGPHQYQLIWTYPIPANDAANVNMYDFNGTGYKQIVESGCNVTRIFEIEAIHVLTPNGGEAYRGGDTCRITWETFNPPRCDSVSLFLRTDSTWRLDTIAHGLPPSDTTYLWQIPPDLRSDYCHVVAIAYGPGWQYDESDTFFTIQPVGVEESGAQPILETKLVGVSPNPIADHAVVSFQLSKQEPVSLRLYDVSGRVVATLTSGIMESGRYSRTFDVRDSRSGLASGVYFLSFDTPDHHENRKLVLAR
jgi:hypothetical protein